MKFKKKIFISSEWRHLSNIFFEKICDFLLQDDCHMTENCNNYQNLVLKHDSKCSQADMQLSELNTQHNVSILIGANITECLAYEELGVAVSRRLRQYQLKCMNNAWSQHLI